MKVVGVKFNKGYADQLYSYFCPYNVAVGSFVVVDSPLNGYVVVEVVEIKPFSAKATKRVVCPVDDTAYKADLNNKARREAILAQLTALDAKRAEIDRFTALAAFDPEAKKLLDELSSMNGDKA